MKKTEKLKEQHIIDLGVCKAEAMKIVQQYSYHLQQCLEKTGEVTKEDIKYCENLAKRVFDYAQNKVRT